MKSYLFLLFFLSAFQTLAQSYSFGPSKEQETFFYRIKNIEDFIDRFNNDPQSSIRIEFKKQHKENLVTRPTLLFSVFNWQNEQLKSDSTTKFFFDTAADTVSPKFLRFRDSNWYADAKSFFTYKGKTIEIPIILHIKDYKEKGVKWMIAGIGDHSLFNTVNYDSADSNKLSANPIKKSIPATNYAVNFLELHKIFNSTLNEASCFDTELLATLRAKQFIQLIKSQELKFLYVTNIKFYFFQLPQWFFTVEEFNRDTKNSGWLINEIKKVSDNEKETIRQNLLQRTIN